MRKNLTRMELIDAASNAQSYIKQLRGILSLLDDKVNQNDTEDAWQMASLLTLVHLACQALEPAVCAQVAELEATHA